MIENLLHLLKFRLGVTRKYIYLLLMLAFGLKSAGGSWDLAYHFKYLRELTQLPHIMNALGNVLAFFILAYLWKTEPKSYRKPLQIFLAGIVLFLLSIPVDDLWHRTFGLDLTAWSPPHVSFYIATMIMLVGTVSLVFNDLKRQLLSIKIVKVLMIILFVFFLDGFWYPLLQTEQGVIALYQYQHQIFIASLDILRIVKTSPEKFIYGGIPEWWYSAYICFATSLLFGVIKKFNLPIFTVTKVAVTYVLFRFVMDLIYKLVDYPTSTVPYFLVLMAVLYDISFYLLRHWPFRLKVLVSSMYLVIGILLVPFVNTDYPIHPPMSIQALPYCLAGALIGIILAILPYHQLS